MLTAFIFFNNSNLFAPELFGKPILLYDIKSRGSEAYLDLAKEVMAHEKKGSREGALRTTAGS